MDSRGYSGVEDEKIRGMACMKESFTSGNPLDDERSNLWPAEERLPGFRRAQEDLLQDCSKLIHQLLECLSLALSLPPQDSFGLYHAGSLFDLDLIHYPPLPAEVLASDGVARNPAHSDFGSLTLLFQDKVGGLEIADPSSTTSSLSADVEREGSFMHIEPEPGTVVVNVGYLLMRWSNCRWRNTVHRVSRPPSCLKEKDEIPERYSIACFGTPDSATVVEALPTCVTEQTPRKWKKPIQVGEYLSRKRAVINA